MGRIIEFLCSIIVVLFCIGLIVLIPVIVIGLTCAVLTDIGLL